MKRTGYSDLPLHYGRVPPWLSERMAKLGRAIVESIILDYGATEVIKRISDPFWFQSFGAVLGMDWHSSGITTSVMGALKKAINPISHDLGMYVCGGRGKHSRKTPQELIEVGNKTGLDGNALARSSRLSAKVDSTAVQDGFQIYLHNFLVTNDGEWAVVQQGMNDNSGYARRYHWHSKSVEDFLSNPHAGVCGQNQGLILNMAHSNALDTRRGTLAIAAEHPTRMITEIKKMRLPAHHDVQIKDVDLKRLGSVIALAHNTNISDFEELLLLQGLGPRTLQSLVLVSEVIHGTESRFSDPARFSFAHGGKDGHPFPVPTQIYDEVIENLNSTVAKAKIGRTDKQKAIKKLHEMAKTTEKYFVPDESKFDNLIKEEWANSNKYGGRTVFDQKDNQKSKPLNNGDQLTLF